MPPRCGRSQFTQRDLGETRESRVLADWSEPREGVDGRTHWLPGAAVLRGLGEQGTLLTGSGPTHGAGTSARRSPGKGFLPPPSPASVLDTLTRTHRQLELLGTSGQLRV